MESRLVHFPMGKPLFIGSLPTSDHHRALEEVLRRTPDSPHWVQLPANPPEGFLVQFCEGAPGLRVEPRAQIDTAAEGFESELVAFYEDYLRVVEGGVSLEETRFVVSPRAAPGLYLLLEALKGKSPWVVKGQISGPLSVLLGIQDQGGRCAYYDERVRDAVVKLLTLKAGWQADLLRQCGRRALVFVDEPAMGGLGSSSYITVSTNEVLAQLGEIVRAIREKGAWAGVHVCANADWGAILAGELDVLSFDAFSYFERVALFRREVAAFLERGGMLAWGIVPTDPGALREVNASKLAGLWRSQAETLAGGETSPTELLRRTFVTPSCGLGSLEPALALRAMDLTVEVSNLLGVQQSGR